MLRRLNFTRMLSTNHNTVYMPKFCSSSNLDYNGWHVGSIHHKSNQRVEKDECVIEVELEKATIGIYSPVTGIIKELHVKEGDYVTQKTKLFTLLESIL